MKIGIITNLFEPYERGGAEHVVKRQIEALRSHHDIFVISTEPFCGTKSLHAHQTESEKGQVRLYRFYPLNIFYYLNDFRHSLPVRLIWQIFDVFNLHAYFQIKKIIKDEKPDWVIMHNLKGIGYLTPLMFRKLKIKTALNLHDIQYANPSGLMFYGQENNFLSSGWPTKIYQKICRFLLCHIDQIISPSRWLINYYRQLDFFTNTSTNIVPNPSNSTPVDKPLNSTTKDIDLLFVGQIEKHKGVNWLVQEALKNQKYSLMIVGQGTELKKLQEKTEGINQIHYSGFIKNNELNNYYKRAKFVVIPSFCYENSPTVIYESYTAGIPVIGARIGGIPELINEGVTGFTFEPGNSDDFHNALKKAFEEVSYSQLTTGALCASHQYTLDEYSLKINKIINY